MKIRPSAELLRLIPIGATRQECGRGALWSALASCCIGIRLLAVLCTCPVFIFIADGHLRAGSVLQEVYSSILQPPKMAFGILEFYKIHYILLLYSGGGSARLSCSDPHQVSGRLRICWRRTCVVGHETMKLQCFQ